MKSHPFGNIPAHLRVFDQMLTSQRREHLGREHFSNGPPRQEQSDQEWHRALHDAWYTNESEPEPSLHADRSVSLCDWWASVAGLDCGDAAIKAQEYGSADLRIMGSVMEQIGLAPTGRGQEAATAFYLLGKIARALGRLSEGQAPSDDTWKDVTIYSMMGRRIRETGGWP